MIVFDVSTIVSAALKADGLPERALLFAEANDLIALSGAVEAEIVQVLHRPRFVKALSPERRARILSVLRDGAAWFEPTTRVKDCRDPKDDKYLELALAASARTIVTGDGDLLVLHPWRGVRIVSAASYLAATVSP